MSDPTAADRVTGEDLYAGAWKELARARAEMTGAERTALESVFVEAGRALRENAKLRKMADTRRDRLAALLCADHRDKVRDRCVECHAEAAERALEACSRELRGLRPGLDKPHPHRGVQREKLDEALQMADHVLNKET